MLDQRIVPRTEYLDRLWRLKDNGSVKVITGMRGCGKSVLLAQFIERLREEDPEAKILVMDFESRRFAGIGDYRKLDRYFDENMTEEHTYVFLDEVQNVKGWEKSVDSLLADGNADIYVAGSNGSLLDSEYSTLMTGRYDRIDMLPFSFREFLEMNPPEDETLDAMFVTYMAAGSLPVIDPEDMEDINDSKLTAHYNNIVRTEVKIRVKDEGGIIDRVAAAIMENIGNEISYTKIAKEAGISTATAKKYAEALEGAYLIYRADRFNIRTSGTLKITCKYYACDTGMRCSLLKKFSDEGRILENIVFLELLRRRYTVAAGDYYGREVDFVATKKKERLYIQVSYSIMDGKTREREIAALKNIPDSYPKLILTADRVFGQPPYGIKTVNVVDWLLGKE